VNEEPESHESDRSTSRLEAFSDGVLAIIVTIMVLEIRPPREPTLESLRPLVPVLLSYLLSFTSIGIYWNNHHHLLNATRNISGSVMWANLHLLFWLSLIPFGTAWIGQEHAHPWPAAIYGMISFMAAVAYTILLMTILRCNKGAGIAEAIGSDVKGKTTIGLYVLGALLAFVNPWLAYAAYTLVAIVWFVPDRRLEWAQHAVCLSGSALPFPRHFEPVEKSLPDVTRRDFSTSLEMTEKNWSSSLNRYRKPVRSGAPRDGWRDYTAITFRRTSLHARITHLTTIAHGACTHVSTSPPIAATFEPTAKIDPQRRIVSVLVCAQILGGIGVAAGSAVGSLLASDLSSEKFAGVASAASVVGAALIAIPVSRLMDARGRRPGLILAYAIGVLGALLVVSGATMRLFPLALLGLILAGGGTTATLQSRYAATDLAPKARRGRALATVVWATTIGSVVGPNLASPMGRFAKSIGIASLAGPYLLTVAVYILAVVLVSVMLRPDPLLEARALRAADTETIHPATAKRSMRDAIATIVAIPSALLGFAAIALGHAVMVAVMSMTPVHIHHVGGSLEIIGIVISLHIAGMYAASPLVGMAADRYGRKPIIALGAGILLASFVVAGTSTGHQTTQLSIGLAMLGLGWSCTMIAGSTLLTDAVPAEQLPNVQGTSDVLMGFAGASAGLLAGVAVGFGSYAILTTIAGIVIVPLLIVTLRTMRSAPQRATA